MSKLYMECHDFIKDNGVFYKDVILKSNRQSNAYFNIKECVVKDSYFTTSLLDLIDRKLTDCEIEYDTIAGVSLGGVLISDKFIQFKHFYNRMNNSKSLNYLVCRKENKDHGLNDVVIGDVEKAKDVVIIDDVITSGESVLNTIGNIKDIKKNINIKAVISIIDRSGWFYEEDKYENYLERCLGCHNCKYLSLYKQEDFII